MSIRKHTKKTFHIVVKGGTLLVAQLLFHTALFAATPDKVTLNNLSRFLTQLERKHPQLKISQAELEAAKARSRSASRPLYNPEIELDAERTGFNRNKTNTVTLGVNQTIDWHNKRSARQNIATIEQKLSQHNQAESRQQLIAGMFSSLAEYQMQREILQANSKRFSLVKQLMNQATKLYKAGDISKLDLEQIRLNVSKSQLTINQAKTQLAVTQQRLSRKAGESRQSWPVLPYTPPVLQTNKLHYEKLLLGLPAYKADATKIAIERGKLRLRVREQKPDPTIGFRAGGEDSNKLIGLTLSIPLTTRNNYQAEVDEARSNIRRAESVFDNSKYQLKSRLKLAAETYQLTYSSWKAWQHVAGKSLKNQSNLLQRLWKAGELSTSEYLLQLDQIREAEMNNVELKGNVWKAWFNWLAVSNQFNKWLAGRYK